MDFYRKRTLWSIMSEERRSLQSPTPLSFSPHQLAHETETQVSPARPSSASVLSTSSPDSPWTLSPIRTSPSPSLFYHCLASLHRQNGNVFSIAISNGIVFTGSESNFIRLWRLPECIERGHIRSSSGEVRALLTFENTLFSTHQDRKIRVWSASVTNNLQPKKIATLPRKSSIIPFLRVPSQQHKDTISCLAYYVAEGLLYSGSHDKTVKVWRVADAKCIDSFVAHEDQINAIVINQEDGCVFTASSDGSVKLWRRVCGESSHMLTVSLRLQPSPVNALAICSSCNTCYLYSGSSDGLLSLWEKEAASGRYNHAGFLHGHRFAVLCLVVKENLVFSGSEDTTIRVWMREDGSGSHSCLAVLEGHRGPVKCISACLEMEAVVMVFLLYSASLDRTVKVWRIKVMHGRNRLRKIEDERSAMNKVEYGMDPVLSPSWVERKLVGI